MLAGAQAQATIHQSHTPASPELMRLIATGEESRTALVRHNMRLVVAIAKRYPGVASHHLSLEDLVSFGSIGLLQGIDMFDPGKGKRLSTYATWWIRQAIGRGIAEETAVTTSVCRDIVDAMQRMRTERERRFLRASFGFDNGQKVTLEAVGATEGLTRERVRQVIVAAVATLRDDPVIAAYGEEGTAG